MDPSGIDVLARLAPALALIVGALLLVRRWAQRGASSSGAGIKVLARTGLTRGAMVAVVEIGGSRYLVGASEHGVSLLSELPEDALSDAAHTTTTATACSSAPSAATDAPRELAPRDRPRMGPIDRLRQMTIRTHLERSIRVPSQS